MICWLTCAIIRDRTVKNTMLIATMPTNISARWPICAMFSGVFPAGIASSITHRVIWGIYSVARLASALISSASSILYLCRTMYFEARFRCFS